eukprot:s37_g40.t1
MGDFNTRLYSNQLDGLQDHIGNTIFSTTVDDDILPTTNLSFMTDFLQDNDFCIVSSMRPRPPSKLVTYLDITSDPPPPSHPTLDTYSVLDHVLCRNEHRSLCRSIPFYPFLTSTYRGTIATSSSPPLCNFLSTADPGHPRQPPRGIFPFPLPSEYQSATLEAFHLPSLPDPHLPPFHIYTDGSCPDQFNVSPSNPAAWGVFFESIFLDYFGPVGSLPFTVNGSNNTAELQAPLEAIALLLSSPPVPPSVHFHLDSQYVIDLLLGISLPSQNIPLASLLLDYFHHLASLTHIRLFKVKSHTGIPGNERADRNADLGLSSRSHIGPALPTDIWRSPLLSGSAHWDLKLADGVRQCLLRSAAGDEKEEEEKEKEKEVSTSSLSSFFKEVFQKVEKDIWADSKGSALLPPDAAGLAKVERCGETWESQPQESAADAKSIPGVKFGSAPHVADWLRQKTLQMPEEDITRDELTEALLKVLAANGAPSSMQKLEEISGCLADLQKELVEQRDSLGAQKEETAG